MVEGLSIHRPVRVRRLTCRFGRALLRLWLLGATAGSIGGAYLEVVATPSSQSTFGLFYRSALAWRVGDDPYGVRRLLRHGLSLPNLNPPLWIPLFAPLTLLPVDAAALVWTMISLLALVGGLIGVVRNADLDAWRSWRPLALAAGPALWETFAQGQVYTLVFLPLALGTVATKRRPGWLAAASLGLAIALKPPLALIVVALFWADRRLAFQTGLASAAWSLAPLPLVRLTPYLHWLAATRLAPSTLAHNASLSALAARWGGPGTGLAVAVLLIGLTVLTGRRIADREAALALGIGASLVTSPITWPTYFVLLVPTFLWLARTSPVSPVLDLALLVFSVPLWLQMLILFGAVPLPALGLALVFALTAWMGWRHGARERPDSRRA